MEFYILHPDLIQRKHPPRWSWQKPGIWYAGLDLPPGPYWHPREYRGYARRDTPVLPGERLELVVVLTDDQPRSYQGIPLRTIRDDARVLRRVRLTKDYTYEELYQSALYRRWKKDGVLGEYHLRPFSSIEHQRSVKKSKPTKEDQMSNNAPNL